MNSGLRYTNRFTPLFRTLISWISDFKFHGFHGSHLSHGFHGSHGFHCFFMDLMDLKPIKSIIHGLLMDLDEQISNAMDF